MNLPDEDLRVNKNHQDHALDYDFWMRQKYHSSDKDNSQRKRNCNFPEIVFIFEASQEYSIYSENLTLSFSILEEFIIYEDWIDDYISTENDC